METIIYSFFKHCFIIAFVVTYALVFSRITWYFFEKSLFYQKIKTLFNYLFIFQVVKIDGELIIIEKDDFQSIDEEKGYMVYDHRDYLVIKKDNNNQELKLEIKPEIFTSLENQLKDDGIIEVNNIMNGFVIKKLKLFTKKSISVICKKKAYSQTLHFSSYSF